MKTAPPSQLAQFGEKTCGSRSLRLFSLRTSIALVAVILLQATHAQTTFKVGSETNCGGSCTGTYSTSCGIPGLTGFSFSVPANGSNSTTIPAGYSLRTCTVALGTITATYSCSTNTWTISGGCAPCAGGAAVAGNGTSCRVYCP